MLVIATVVASIVAIAPARADEAADREEAGRAFAAGQAADRQKDWPLAIQHYVRANDLLPHPNAMFNIATDYERLGKPREAAVWYRRYLDAAPDAADHEKVVKTLRDLTTKPSAVTIRTNPPGARILVDGEFLGTSPFTGKIKGGSHRLTFEYEGRREQKQLTIEFGEPAVLDQTLSGESGRLRVIGAPMGAIVTVDDQPAGSLPAELDLPPGPHTVHVEQTGYAPYDTTAQIFPQRDTIVRAMLSHSLGAIDGPTKTIRAGYLFGFGGGADLKGEGAIVLLDLGIAALSYDAAVRIGKTAGLTAIDFVARWSIGKARLAPYVGAGYSVVVDKTQPDASSSSSTSSGYTLIGGIKFEITRNEHTALALIVESGLRYYPSLASTTGTDRSALVVPIMTSLQVVYK